MTDIPTIRIPVEFNFDRTIAIGKIHSFNCGIYRNSPAPLEFEWTARHAIESEGDIRDSKIS